MPRLAPPLLVLDFDGVLSVCPALPPDVPPLTATQRLRRAPVERLDRIVRETSAQIVISSTWRDHGPKQLGAWLALFGFHFAERIIAVTPHLPGDRRAAEIQACLDRLPPPRALAVLEDEEPMEHLTPWTVRTVYEDLLTEGDARRVIQLLNRRGRTARPRATATAA